jgi:hypothetical protein
LIIKIIQFLTINSYVCLTAGILGLYFSIKLYSYEKLIVGIIWINVVADLIGSIMAIKFSFNEVVFNVSAPIEQVLTLYVYSKGDKKKSVVYIHRISMVLIIILLLSNYVIIKNPYGFHYYTFIISGIIVAVFSYWQLKSLIQQSHPWRSVILWFSGANLIYYSSMVSSVSSMPLANDISRNLAMSIKTINDVGYIIWSLLIAIGILWNKKKNT